MPKDMAIVKIKEIIAEVVEQAKADEWPIVKALEKIVQK